MYVATSNSECQVLLSITHDSSGLSHCHPEPETGELNTIVTAGTSNLQSVHSYRDIPSLSLDVGDDRCLTIAVVRAVLHQDAVGQRAIEVDVGAVADAGVAIETGAAGIAGGVAVDDDGERGFRDGRTVERPGPAGVRDLDGAVRDDRRTVVVESHGGRTDVVGCTARGRGVERRVGNRGLAAPGAEDAGTAGQRSGPGGAHETQQRASAHVSAWVTGVF